jgi:arylsulfatase A-like enzyme
MKNRVYICFMLGLLLLSGCKEESKITKKVEKERPNVLLIAVDDLNDWIGVLGGHPQAKTPHMDRLAKRGVLFNNAHCQAPVCNPSRASLMTSLYPSTSGIYFLNPDITESPVASKNIVMPIRYQQEGYNVFAAGKIFHNGKGSIFLIMRDSLVGLVPCLTKK